MYLKNLVFLTVSLLKILEQLLVIRTDTGYPKCNFWIFKQVSEEPGVSDC